MRISRPDFSSAMETRIQLLSDVSSCLSPRHLHRHLQRQLFIPNSYCSCLSVSLLCTTGNKHLSLTDSSGKKLWGPHRFLSLHRQSTGSSRQFLLHVLPRRSSGLCQKVEMTVAESRTLTLPHLKSLLCSHSCFRLSSGKWDKIVPSSEGHRED